MKNKIFIPVLIVAAVLLFVLISTPLLPNIWGITTEKHYFIPTESNVFVFNVTKMNDGSGDWWLYGEDNTNYYALNRENTNPLYFIKKKGEESQGFDKYDHETW